MLRPRPILAGLAIVAAVAVGSGVAALTTHRPTSATAGTDATTRLPDTTQRLDRRRPLGDRRGLWAAVTGDDRRALLLVRARRTAPAGRTPGPFTCPAASRGPEAVTLDGPWALLLDLRIGRVGTSTQPPRPRTREAPAAGVVVCGATPGRPNRYTGPRTGVAARR
jgi:hypothetical protein